MKGEIIMIKKVVVLLGDGVGIEVIKGVVVVLKVIGECFDY